MKTLHQIANEVAGQIESGVITTKKGISDALMAGVKVSYDPAIVNHLEWIIKEKLTSETLNTVYNDTPEFVEAAPEVRAFGRGFLSVANEKKRTKPAVLPTLKGAKSAKIDNSLFCKMLKMVMDKAPSEGGYHDKDLPILQKLHDALVTNKYSVARVIEVSEAKIANAADDENRKAAQHEHNIRFAVITMIESEIERLAKEAAQKQLDEVLDLL